MILLENTDEGYNWNLSYEVRRPFRNGFFFSGAYSYGVGQGDHGRHVRPGGLELGQRLYVPAIRTTHRWRVSNFDPAHRMTLSGAYDVNLGKGFLATLSAFYSGQTGRPYTLTYQPRRQRRQPRH